VTAWRRCEACTGTGFESTDPEDSSRCGECGGTGLRAIPEPVPVTLEGDRADTEAAGLVCSWCGLTWCSGHGGDV
jgi:hypothetical protein